MHPGSYIWQVDLRIREAQKHVNPVDSYSDPDPEHLFFDLNVNYVAEFSASRGTSATLSPCCRFETCNPEITGDSVIFFIILKKFRLNLSEISTSFWVTWPKFRKSATVLPCCRIETCNPEITEDLGGLEDLEPWIPLISFCFLFSSSFGKSFSTSFWIMWPNFRAVGYIVTLCGGVGLRLATRRLPGTVLYFFLSSFG